MKVLVTGASGFIGRNLVARLGDRFRLLAPGGRRDFDLLDGDSVRAFLRRERPDAVVHAATTPGHRNAPPVPDLAARNLRMFFHLAENADCFERLIALGSGAEYDTRFELSRVPESAFGAQVPADDTGFSKFVISRFVQQRSGWVHLRPFGVYGPHEDWEIRFISNAICKALFDLPITLRQDRRFDYVHVDDLVEVVARLLDRPAKHSDYNVTPDASASLLEIAGLVREIAGKAVPIRVAREGQGLGYSGDNARLRADFPDLSLKPLREGIAELYRWYAARRELVDPALLRSDK